MLIEKSLWRFFVIYIFLYSNWINLDLKTSCVLFEVDR